MNDTKKNDKKKKEVLEKSNPLYKHTYKDSLRELIPYAVAIIVIVIIRMFVVTPVKVNGTSMINTLHHGDTMILNKIGIRFNEIKRFQIVVIKTDKSYLIKRVIGLPGETIKYEVKENNGNNIARLFINGKKVEEKFISDDVKLETCKEEYNICNKSYRIPKDNYFVMGDNRGNSIDSRIIGTIKRKDITGTTKLIIFPINDIGIAK